MFLAWSSGTLFETSVARPWPVEWASGQNEGEYRADRRTLEAAQGPSVTSWEFCLYNLGHDKVLPLEAPDLGVLSSLFADWVLDKEVSLVPWVLDEEVSLVPWGIEPQISLLHRVLDQQVILHWVLDQEVILHWVLDEQQVILHWVLDEQQVSLRSLSAGSRVSVQAWGLDVVESKSPAAMHSDLGLYYQKMNGGTNWTFDGGTNWTLGVSKMGAQIGPAGIYIYIYNCRRPHWTPTLLPV